MKASVYIENSSSAVSQEFIVIPEVYSFDIDDSLTTLTNTGTIIIPKNIFTVVEQKERKYGKQGELTGSYSISNTFVVNEAVPITKNVLREGKRVWLFANDENIFIGYITFVKELLETFEITVEDEMYKLKKLQTSKFSIPLTIEKNGFAIYDKRIPLEKPQVQIFPGIFVGEKLKLHHILYYIFTNAGYSDKEIYCFDLDIGKLKLNDYLQPAEIIKLLIDRFGFFAYFKLQDQENSILKKQVLYVGSKYWSTNQAIKISDTIKLVSDRIKKGSKDISQTDVIKKSSTVFDDSVSMIEFAYPYIEGMNCIIEHNLQFVDTKQQDLIVVVKSVQSHSSDLFIGSYPPDKRTADIENAHKLYCDILSDELEVKRSYRLAEKFKSDSKKTTLTTEQKKAKFKRLLQAADRKDDYVRKRKEELKASDYIQLSREASNYITIELPDLTKEKCEELAKERYNQVKKSGFQGTFRTFGDPYVSVGDVVSISLGGYYDEDGVLTGSIHYHYVDKVYREYSEGGYYQTITIGNEYLLPAVKQYVIEDINKNKY